MTYENYYNFHSNASGFVENFYTKNSFMLDLRPKGDHVFKKFAGKIFKISEQFFFPISIIKECMTQKSSERPFEFCLGLESLIDSTI